MFQRDIETCFFAVPGSADQHMKETVFCVYAAVLFHAFQLMAMDLNAEAL